ncbi:MAG: hypothetical protein ABI311_11920 [Gemmatimonadaceae bacterium]
MHEIADRCIFAVGFNASHRRKRMAVTLVLFDEPLLSADGRIFTAQVRCQQLATGLWEAWLEFQPHLRGDTVITPPETQQLSRGDLRFWAAGITPAHLADSLCTALQSQATISPHPRFKQATEPNAQFDRAAIDVAVQADAGAGVDPIALYERTGEYALRQVLRELDAPQLADIIEAMGLDDADVLDLAPTYEDALAERIVAGVQQYVELNRTVSRKTDVRLTD